MSHESDPPTTWEKLRDNVAPVLAVAIILGMMNMYGTQQSILEAVTSLKRQVERVEARVDKIVNRMNGVKGD